ncbi:Na+/H+ antiporter NhaC family protein [Natrialba sp. PRR66]|uniref:Na+/H+ antiporter NhaC family protein n=1 Tax=Natrialba sp. PRR66 TaxID=3098146 RepID=UPI002B1E4A0D|nr:Na+/H+ antiporter NhaC family protein [Natrialba sp. PRR66]
MSATAYGAWSLLPLILAISIAIKTRKAIIGLFLGVWSGGTIYRYFDGVELAENVFTGLGLPSYEPLNIALGLIIAGFWGSIDTLQWISESVGESVFNMQIILLVLFLGSAIAMIWKLGGTLAAAEKVTEYVDSKRKAGIAAWVMGIGLFFDDYANAAIVGTTMKDISDALNMSREKLSYIVDSTAAPVSTIALSSWVAFQMSMINTGYEATEIPADEIPSSFLIFIQSIPFNMYSILAIFMVGIIVLTQRDFGEMLSAEHRARETGKVNREQASPMQDIKGDLGDPIEGVPRMLRTFFAPVFVLLGVVVVGALITGYEPGRTLRQILINADYVFTIVVGSFAMVATTWYYAYVYDYMSIGESVDTSVKGFKIMLTPLTILVLAWTIGSVVEQLGTGDYVANYATLILTPETLPIVILLIGSFMAFTMGDAWAVMAILTPIAVPLAWELTGDHTMVAVVVGATFSGAIFGDHSSPVAPTTVLAATFTGADLIDHVRTQIYYAVTVVAVSTALLLTWGYGAPIWGRSIWAAIALIPVGIVLLYGIVYFLSEWDGRRKNISPSVASQESHNLTADDD